MEAIIQRIRTLMEEQHLSQKRLADELQVSYSALNNYLNGRRWLSLPLLCRLCQCLHTSADYLLGLSDEKNPSALPDDEQTLLVRYRTLPSVAKRFILASTHQLDQLCRQIGKTALATHHP